MTFAIPANLTTVAYIGAIILFILSLGGLSNPETSRRGNWFGIIGMTIAVLATIFGTRLVGFEPNQETWRLVKEDGLIFILVAMALGGKGYCLMAGTTADVRAGVSAAAAEARKRGLLVSEVVIPRPSDELFSEYV